MWMYDEMDMESCVYGVSEAVEACSFCDDIGVASILPAVFGGILGGIGFVLPEVTDTIGGDLIEVESIYEDWSEYVKDEPLLKGSIDFVVTQFPDLENEDAIIAGSKIALRVSEEIIKKAGKEEQYAAKIDAAHESLEKVEKTKQMKNGEKKQKRLPVASPPKKKWWHFWKK